MMKPEDVKCLKEHVTKLEKGEIRFRTINILDRLGNKSNGRIIAVTEPLNEEKTKFRAQFAFCNPNENYSKWYGRFIAFRRLASMKVDVIIDRNDTSIPMKEYLKEAALNEAARRGIWWVKGTQLNELV